MEQNKTTIRITREFRDKLGIYRIKGKFKNYEELLNSWETSWLSSLQQDQEKEPE